MQWGHTESLLLTQSYNSYASHISNSIFLDEMTIKIAHLQLLPLLTGVQNVSLQEFRSMQGDTFKYTLICAADGPFVEAAKALGVEVIILEDLVREISPIKDLKTYLALRNIFKQHQFDIVHTHSSKTGFLGRLAARGLSQTVHTVHGFAFPAAKSKWVRLLYQILERIAGKYTNKLICLNSDDAAFSISQLNIPDAVIEIVPNGVDLERFTPSLESTSDVTDKPKVIFLGRLWEQKNPQSFVKAAISILKDLSLIHI